MQINIKWYSWIGAFKSHTAKDVFNVKDVKRYILRTLFRVDFYGKHPLSSEEIPLISFQLSTSITYFKEGLSLSHPQEYLHKVRVLLRARWLPVQFHREGRRPKQSPVLVAPGKKKKNNCWKDWWKNGKKFLKYLIKTELCSFVRPKSTMASENKIGSASWIINAS